jgi:hypothetical protein
MIFCLSDTFSDRNAKTPCQLSIELIEKIIGSQEVRDFAKSVASNVVAGAVCEAGKRVIDGLIDG